MGSSMCCGNNPITEIYPESILLDSKTYRANLVQAEKVLESIEHVNSKVQEPDQMDKINKLLDIAETRINTEKSFIKSPALITLAKTSQGRKIKNQSLKCIKQIQL
jgi:hypothetical protein